MTAACDEIGELRKALKGLGNSTNQSLGVVSILRRQKNIEAIDKKVFIFLFLKLIKFVIVSYFISLLA